MDYNRRISPSLFTSDAPQNIDLHINALENFGDRDRQQAGGQPVGIGASGLCIERNKRCFMKVHAGTTDNGHQPRTRQQVRGYGLPVAICPARGR